MGIAGLPEQAPEFSFELLQFLEPGVWRLFGNLPELLARLPHGTKDVTFPKLP